MRKQEKNMFSFQGFALFHTLLFAAIRNSESLPWESGAWDQAGWQWNNYEHGNKTLEDPLISWDDSAHQTTPLDFVDTSNNSATTATYDDDYSNSQLTTNIDNPDESDSYKNNPSENNDNSHLSNASVYNYEDSNPIENIDHHNSGTADPIYDIGEITSGNMDNLYDNDNSTSNYEAVNINYTASKDHDAAKTDDTVSATLTTDYAAANVDYTANNTDYNEGKSDYAATSTDYNEANSDYAANNTDYTVAKSDSATTNTDYSEANDDAEAYTDYTAPITTDYDTGETTKYSAFNKRNQGGNVDKDHNITPEKQGETTATPSRASPPAPRNKPKKAAQQSKDYDYNYDGDNPDYSYSYAYDYNTNTATTVKVSTTNRAKTTTTTVVAYGKYNTTNNNAANNKQKPATRNKTNLPPKPAPAPAIPGNELDWRSYSSSSSSSSSQSSSEITCPPLKIKSGVKLECLSRIQNNTSESGFVVAISNCQNPQIEGTEATYECGSYYESPSGVGRQYRKCRNNGKWTGSDDRFLCDLECGKQNPAGRTPLITSGDVSPVSAFPWHVGLFIRESERGSSIFDNACGGTLINERVILTAAHCVVLQDSLTVRKLSDFRVDLGRYYKDREDEQHVQSFQVERIIHHPLYNSHVYESDIAIIILKGRAKIGFHVRPICYQKSQNSVFETLLGLSNTYATVVGWGVDETGKQPDELRTAKLKVIGYHECIRRLEESNIGSSNVRSTTFCAGNRNATNVCKGDSGSGAYFRLETGSGGTRWYLQGLVSVGIDVLNKCDPTSVSIFTKISSYSDWISRVLSENDVV